MDAIALVVVRGGVVEMFTPLHVDVRTVDFNNIQSGDDPTPLPRNVGFEALVQEAALEEGEDFVWEA